MADRATSRRPRGEAAPAFFTRDEVLAALIQVVGEVMPLTRWERRMMRRGCQRRRTSKGWRRHARQMKAARRAHRT